MMPLALDYWQQVATRRAISTDFQKIATKAIDSLKRLQKIA
jgi:hypothetical protein